MHITKHTIKPRSRIQKKRYKPQTTTKPTITLYYDVVSPYSYAAYKVLQRYEDENKLTLEPIPVYLGGLLKAANLPLPYASSTSKQKAKYFKEDLKRCAAYYQCAMHLPKEFPINTILPMRVLAYLYSEGEVKMMRALSLVLWSKYLMHDINTDTEEVVLECLKEVGYKEELAEQVLRKALDEENKEKLKSNTLKASEKGAWGVPTMFADVDGSKEMYFGADRLFLLFHRHPELTWEGPNPIMVRKMRENK